jgi:hypothetical protein
MPLLIQSETRRYCIPFRLSYEVQKWAKQDGQGYVQGLPEEVTDVNEQDCRTAGSVVVNVSNQKTPNHPKLIKTNN